MTPTIGQGDPNSAIQARTFDARIKAAEEKDKINRNPNYSPPPNQRQQPQPQPKPETKLTAADRMEAAGQAMAKEFMLQMAKKLTERDGDEGADRSRNALSGDKAWEKFYTGNEFASLPAWYM